MDVDSDKVVRVTHSSGLLGVGRSSRRATPFQTLLLKPGKNLGIPILSIWLIAFWWKLLEGLGYY
jgi:hypothetical protein